MNFKNWVWFLVELDGRVRQVVNGVVQSLNKKTEIPEAPIGWEETGVVWERNTERFGSIRNFAFPLKFVLTAYKITQNDSYKFNTDRRLFVLLMRFTSEVSITHFKNYYKFFYKGELDMSTAHDRQGEESMEIALMEGGLSKAMKANEGTEKDFPLDDRFIFIKHDGIPIDNTFEAIIDNGDSQVGADYFGNHVIGLLMTTSEMEAAGTAKSTLRTKLVAPSTNPVIRATGQTVLKATVAGTVKIDCKFKVIVEYTPNAPAINPAAIWKIVVRRIDEANVSDLETVLLTRTAAAGIPGTYNVQGTFSIDVRLKDELYFIAVCNIIGATGDAQIRCNYVIEDDTFFKLTYQFRGATSYIRAFLPDVLHRKLVGGISGNEDDAVSVVLESCPVALTSGDAVRGVKGASVKTNYSNFFKAYNVYELLGQSFENDKITLERRQHFFKTGLSTQLGASKDFETEVATDLMGSSIKIGHQEQTINSVNGKYDYCGWIVYGSPIKSGVTNQIDLQAPFKAGPFEIEELRTSLDGKSTTDGLTDNTIFALVVNRATVILKYNIIVSFINATQTMIFPAGTSFRPEQTIRITGSVNNNFDYLITSVANIIIAQIASLSGNLVTDEANVPVQIEIISGAVYELDRSIVPDSGVPHPADVYNVALRPAELIKKHFPWIAGWTYGFEMDKLTFKDFNRNKDLVVGGVADKDDISINSFAAQKMFIPRYFTFGTLVPTDLVETLDADQNKDFATDWGVTKYEGFLWKAGIAANTEQEQTFKLLAAPTTDLKTLIL